MNAAPTQKRTLFDPTAFRAAHRPEIVEPIRDGQQTRLDGRVRVIVRRSDELVAYDSQREHGEAGIFAARDEALEHGMSWVEAICRLEQRREQLEVERRYAVSDVQSASQKREKDYRGQRKDLTAKINRERAVQSALSDEARDPKVKIEFRGGCIFDVIDEPSVFDGTLDAEGREVPKPKGRAEGRAPAGPPAEPPPPASSDPVEATETRLTAANYRNGNAKQDDVISGLEAYASEVDSSTLCAIAIGEHGRKSRRAALDEYLAERQVDALGDRSALVKGLDTPAADFAAAALLTSTSTSTSDLLGWIVDLEDLGVLRWALDREQQRPKPREKLIKAINDRIDHAVEWAGNAAASSASGKVLQ